MLSSELLTTTAEERERARRAWAHLEVVHALGIFGPDVGKAHGALGIDDPMVGYVASRIAPLGPVGPEVAAATFHGVAPGVTRRALPEVWDVADPGAVVEATRRASGALLARLTDGLEDEVARAAELAREASLFHPVDGRVLAAARSGLPWPEEPEQVLWEAATRIRESRGDGHVACLVTAGLDPVEAHLTVAGDTEEAGIFLRQLQGWSEPEWTAAVGRLVARGLLDDQGGLTDAGRRLRRDLEEHTDALAVPPWRQLGEEATETLIEVLSPVVWRILDAEILPMPAFRQRVVDPRGAAVPEVHDEPS